MHLLIYTIVSFFKHATVSTATEVEKAADNLPNPRYGLSAQELAQMNYPAWYSWSDGVFRWIFYKYKFTDTYLVGTLP